MDILKQQGLSCYCTVCVIAAPNKEHTCLIWAQGFSHAQWSRGAAPIIWSKTHQGESSERERERRRKKKKTPATCFYLKQSVWWWGEGNVPLPGWSALPTEHIISCFPSVSESPRYLPWRATDCSTQSCQEGLATAQKARHKDAERLPDENERGMNWICTLSQKRVFIKCMTHFQRGVFEVRVWQTHPAPNLSEYRANRVCSVSIISHWNEAILHSALKKNKKKTVYLYSILYVFAKKNSPQNCRLAECQQEAQWSRGE